MTEKADAAKKGTDLVASFPGKAAGQEALPSGRAFFVAGVLLLAVLGAGTDAFAQASIKGCEMKEEEAAALGEQFGIAVGPDHDP